MNRRPLLFIVFLLSLASAQGIVLPGSWGPGVLGTFTHALFALTILFRRARPNDSGLVCVPAGLQRVRRAVPLLPLALGLPEPGPVLLSARERRRD